jgi:hypothetical protein
MAEFTRTGAAFLLTVCLWREGRAFMRSGRVFKRSAALRLETLDSSVLPFLRTSLLSLAPSPSLPQTACSPARRALLEGIVDLAGDPQTMRRSTARASWPPSLGPLPGVLAAALGDLLTVTPEVGVLAERPPKT